MKLSSPKLINKYFFASIFLFICFSSQAQLGFCQGNSGNPIFEEDFGQGTQNGPPLSTDITSYEYVSQGPQDGEYTISSSLFQLGSFHNTGDHTGNTNGKALIVNASFDAGLFYQIPITGLCINNSYEFSAFLMNVYDADSNACPNNGIPVNVRFQIWDETDTTLLAEGNTGNINGTSNPIWQQFALTFTTLTGQDSVILKMLNNGEGGCGNDLAIDDIVFKSCGDLTEIITEDGSSSLQICENENIDNLTLEASPDFSVYDSPSYQWQESSDAVNWTNIPGETGNELTITNPSSSQFYRTLVSEDAANVSNNACNSISSIFEVQIIELVDPVSEGDVFVCEGDEQNLSVQTNNNITVDWYDSPTGGNLLAENTFEFEPEANGTYYAEATTINGNCTNPNRVAIQYLLYETPQLEDESTVICEGEVVTLSEDIENVEYLWNTGETSNSIEVEEAGEYTLEITTENNCVVSKIFTVETITAPVIENISQNSNTLTVEMASEGDFSYSIDGNNYQNLPIFNNLEGGLYTIYVLENNGCGIATEEYILLVIPEFFTPNGDQINDKFEIEGDTYFDEFEIVIFDRYGKVLKQGRQAPFEWDGTYNGKNMPTDDYWYRLTIDGKTYTGNITLLR
ncbi:MAG: T9SS type B sorting domain-containing protein [Psychroflexus sp.]